MLVVVENSGPGCGNGIHFRKVYWWTENAYNVDFMSKLNYTNESSHKLNV